MGADLVTTNLWSKCSVNSPHEFDWEAGLRAARELSDEACERLAEQTGEDFDYVDGDVVEVRNQAVVYVENLRTHLTGFSRDLNTFETPDGQWTCWLTGGLSWGDSPSDLYDAINDLWAVPEVLKAIGFWTGVGT